MKDLNIEPQCPIFFSMSIFGDKWTLVILRDMLLLGKRHFGEFLSSHEKIASNILAARLKKLEDNGILTKGPDPKNQAKTLYTLTEKGINLVPVILSVVEWGIKYQDNALIPDEFLKELKKIEQSLKKGTGKNLLGSTKKEL